MSATSLMAMKSTSSRRCLTARSTIRPMRPNPLIATRAAMGDSFAGNGRTLYGKGSGGRLLVEQRHGIGIDAGGAVERHTEVGQEAGEQAGRTGSRAVARVGQGKRHKSPAADPVPDDPGKDDERLDVRATGKGAQTKPVLCPAPHQRQVIGCYPREEGRVPDRPLIRAAGRLEVDRRADHGLQV